MPEVFNFLAWRSLCAGLSLLIVVADCWLNCYLSFFELVTSGVVLKHQLQALIFFKMHLNTYMVQQVICIIPVWASWRCVNCIVEEVSAVWFNHWVHQSLLPTDCILLCFPWFYCKAKGIFLSFSFDQGKKRIRKEVWMSTSTRT